MDSSTLHQQRVAALLNRSKRLQQTAMELEELGAYIRHLEADLRQMRRWRRMLVNRLLKGGLSERAVAHMAGISHVAVHQMKEDT